MRSQLSKTVKKEFELKLKKEFPQFDEDKNAIIPPQCKVYVWKVSENFWAFIVLIVSPKDDSFTIEIAWTENKEFPKYAITEPNDVPKDGDARFRLSRLINFNSDYWWYLSRKRNLDDDLLLPDEPLETSLKKVLPSVSDAIQQVKTHAIPYFVRIETSKRINAS